MDLHEAESNIVRLSADLESTANEMHEMSQRMYDLKYEIFLHQLNEDERIRTQEQGGKLVTADGREIKLTDATRLSLTQEGKKEQNAEYEALKRKRETLEQVIKAKCSALSGYQSIAGIFKKEMETLSYTQRT